MEEEVVIEGQAPTGRDAILEMYRTANPNTEGDPTDDDLLGFAHQRHSDIEGRYNDLLGANQGLADKVAADPRMGAFLSMIAGEDSRSVPFAVGNVFGRDWLDGDLEEFEKGYQEHLARLAESRAEQEQAAKNIEEYQKNLETFAKENELTEEQAAQLNDAIYADAENFLMGNIPVEYIDYKWKGMNYEKDVQEAAETGMVEGRNQTIEVKKKKVTGEAPLPDLGNGTGAGVSRVAKKIQKKGSFFDELKETD